MLTRKKELQGSGRASTLVPAAPAPRHPLAKILVPVPATLSLPIPRASNFTPDTCSANLSMGSGMGKGVSSAGNRGVGPSGEKGAWSRRETQKRTPPSAPGVAVAQAEPLQDTRPREKPALHGPAAPRPRVAGLGAGGHQPVHGLSAAPPSGRGRSQPPPGRPSRAPSTRPHSPLYTPVERGHAEVTAAADRAVCRPPARPLGTARVT